MKGILACGLAAGLMALAQPAAAADCPPLKQIGNIQLVKRGSYWLVPVGINGTPREMFLNTGMGITTITPETVAELKLPRHEQRNAVLTSSNGIRSYATTNVERLALGMAGQFNNSEYVIDTDLPDGAKRPAGAPAGYVGLELLSHFDFDLDLKNGVLNLFSWDHCDGQVVYWKTEAAVPVTFEWDSQGRIRFKVKLDGTQLYAVLDTTDAADTVNLTYYKSQVGFDETAAGVEHLPDSGDGGKMYRTHFKTLEINGLTIKDPQMFVREDKMAEKVRAGSRLGTSISNTEDKRMPDITLGLSSLAKLHVYVASKEKKLYISAAP